MSIPYAAPDGKRPVSPPRPAVREMKRKDRGFPCDAAPDVHQFRGVPQDCFDLVNRYGTYNIQPTTDTENLFPLIGPELPERWRHMSLGKDDLEHLG